MRFNTDIIIKLWFLNTVVDSNIKFNGSQPALKHGIANLNVHKKYFYVYLKKIQCMCAWAMIQLMLLSLGPQLTMPGLY